MATIALAVLLFAAAVSLLSIGTMLGKRDKLKGSCAAQLGPAGQVEGLEDRACDDCACGPHVDGEGCD